MSDDFLAILEWTQAEHQWKLDVLPHWEGHPWAAAEHRTVGYHRAWCHGCGTWCYPHYGCWCCNEPAHEYLLAEARWWAEEARSGWHVHVGDGPTYKVGASLFPWEVVSGG